MGDILKKVQAGDLLQIPASTFNAFIDAAIHARAGPDEVGRPGRGRREAGVVLVKNGTGDDRNIFDVVSLSEPVVSPADNLDEFRFRFAMKAVAPFGDNGETLAANNVAILQEPVKAGAFGRAMVSGITPAQIEIAEDADLALRFATAHVGGFYLHLEDRLPGEPAPGDPTPWQPASMSGAYIMWIDPAVAPGGPYWAIVRLGGPEPPGMPLSAQEFFTDIALRPDELSKILDFKDRALTFDGHGRLVNAPAEAVLKGLKGHVDEDHVVTWEVV